MSDLLQRLVSEEKIHCPKWLSSNCMYLTIMGSTAYGTNNDNSDRDYYGWCIEPIDHIFPHVKGLVVGFDDIPKFEVWQEHHVKDGNNEYDFQVFGMIKYFKLLSGCNPNVLESIYTPLDCVHSNSRISQLVRLNRSKFLSKLVFHKFRGYCYGELHKIDSPGTKTGKRKDIVEKYGFDTKNLANVVRLCLECEQLLEEGDLDLRRHSKLIRAIRDGEWPPEKIKEWFTSKEQYLNGLYEKSHLPAQPDRAEIKDLLMKCIEEHYGSLDKYVRQESNADKILNQIQDYLNART